MTKTSKKLLIVLAVLLAVFIVIFIFANAAYTPPKQELVYPSGALSDSYFSSESASYTPSDLLQGTHTYKTVPYDVDVTGASPNELGNGAAYKVSDSVLIYVTEYSEPSTIQGTIQADLPPAILMNYRPENTNLTAMADQTGYIYGYTAEYIADRIEVSDGSRTQQAAVFGYAINVGDDYEGNYAFVGVVTTDMSQATFDAVPDTLDSLMKTFRFDSNTDTLLKAKQQINNPSFEDVVTEKSDDEASGDGISDSGASSADVSYMADDVHSETIPVTQNYSQLTININWSDSYTDAVLELFLPDGQSFASPVTQTDTSATFVLDSPALGNYTLNIKGYSNLGTVEPIDAQGVAAE